MCIYICIYTCIYMYTCIRKYIYIRICCGSATAPKRPRVIRVGTNTWGTKQIASGARRKPVYFFVHPKLYKCTCADARKILWK